MGLLDVDLMNRIRRELDRRYGKGVKLVFGEPWAADEAAMEGGAVPALKKNVRLLDENIGMFCDNTRDAIKGSALKTKPVSYTHLDVYKRQGENDSEEEMEKEAKWIASVDPQIVLHVTRFFPRYRMTDRQAADVEQIYRLRDTAGRYLKNVYTGNC